MTQPQKPKKQEALYPYTLQPVALDMTEAEFKSAQLALFEKSMKTVGVKSIRPKEWIVLSLITIGAVAGLVWVDGYSTIFFWLLLAGVVIYLLLRTLGMSWYMRREFDKQVSEITIPDEMYSLKLGMFDVQGQRGSQIIPKRLKDKGLPINTIIKHLSEVKAKGLDGSAIKG